MGKAGPNGGRSRDGAWRSADWQSAVSPVGNRQVVLNNHMSRWTSRGGEQREVRRRRFQFALGILMFFLVSIRQLANQVRRPHRHARR